MSNNCDFYTEFNSDTLRIQLSILVEFYHSFSLGEATLHNIVDFLKKIRSLIPEVTSLVKIILVMPATNACSERALSALRRVKSYICRTMSKNCLNHLITCAVRK